jgi:hypothetical protein
MHMHYQNLQDVIITYNRDQISLFDVETRNLRQTTNCNLNILSTWDSEHHQEIS